MKFNDALICLDEGSKITRGTWGPLDTFIVKMPSLYLPPRNTEGAVPKVNDRTAKHIGDSTPLDSQPYLAMFKKGKWQPGWLPSTEDLFANDWHRLTDKIFCCGGSGDSACVCVPVVDNPTLDEIKEKFIQTVAYAYFSDDPDYTEEKELFIKTLRETINIDRPKSESDIYDDDPYGSFIKHFQD